MKHIVVAALLLGFASTSFAQTCTSSDAYRTNAARIDKERRQNFAENEVKLNAWEKQSGLSKQEAVFAFMGFSTPEFIQDSEKQNAVLAKIDALRTRLAKVDNKKECATLMQLEEEDLHIGMRKMRRLTEAFIARKNTENQTPE